MRPGKWRFWTALGVFLLSLQEAAWAQHGYVSAPMLSPSAAHSLDKAILVLGIPPLTIFIGIFVYFYRRQRANSRSL
jgi:hypothetical protein